MNPDNPFESPFDNPPDKPEHSNSNPWNQPPQQQNPPYYQNPPQYQNPQENLTAQNVNQSFGYNEQQPQFFRGHPGGQVMPNQMLPNSTLILVFGIIGIVMGCGIIGLIINIVNLVLASSARKLVVTNPPGTYTERSVKQMNAGRVCSIVGLCMLPLTIVIAVIMAAAGEL